MPFGEKYICEVNEANIPPIKKLLYRNNNPQSYVYVLESALKPGKYYVGSTRQTDVFIRIQQHLDQIDENVKIVKHTYFYDEMRRLLNTAKQLRPDINWRARYIICIERIDICDPCIIEQQEEYWLRKYDSLYHGYNSKHAFWGIVTT